MILRNKLIHLASKFPAQSDERSAVLDILVAASGEKDIARTVGALAQQLHRGDEPYFPEPVVDPRKIVVTFAGDSTSPSYERRIEQLFMRTLAPTGRVESVFVNASSTEVEVTVYLRAVTKEVAPEFRTKDAVVPDVKVGDRIVIDRFEGVVTSLKTQVRTQNIPHPTDPFFKGPYGERKVRVTSIRLMNSWGQHSRPFTFKQVISERIF